MFAAVKWVRDHMPATIDPRAHVVAFVIASCASSTGVATVGVRRIAAYAHMTPKSVVRCIRTLEGAGMFAVDRSSGRRSVYRFPVQDAVQDIHNRDTKGRAVALPTTARLSTATARPTVARVGCVNTLDRDDLSKSHEPLIGPPDHIRHIFHSSSAR